MADDFDPYYHWLGISPKDQPPHHYRLLGIDPFEENPRVIETAADRQMAHLRTFQTGKRSALSQKLLNEVAAARVCLLNPAKKAAYDATLQEKIEAASPKQEGPPDDLGIDPGLAAVLEASQAGGPTRKPPAGPPSLPKRAAPSACPKADRLKRSKGPVIAACVATAAALLGIVIAALFMAVDGGGGNGADPLGNSGGSDTIFNYLPDDTTQIVSFDVASASSNRIYRKFVESDPGDTRGRKRIFCPGRNEKIPYHGLLPDISRITFAEQYWDLGVAVVQLKREIPPEECFKRLGADASRLKRRQIAGRPFYSNDREGIVFADSRTIVCGYVAIIEAILERNGPPKPSTWKTLSVIQGVGLSHSMIRIEDRGLPKLEEALFHRCGILDSGVAIFEHDPTAGGMRDLGRMGSLEGSVLINAYLECTAVVVDVGSDLSLTAKWVCRDEESARKVEISMRDLLAKTIKDPGASPQAREMANLLKVSRSGETVTLRTTLSEAFLDRLPLGVEGLSESKRKDAIKPPPAPREKPGVDFGISKDAIEPPPAPREKPGVDFGISVDAIEPPPAPREEPPKIALDVPQRPVHPVTEEQFKADLARAKTPADFRSVAESGLGLIDNLLARGDREAANRTAVLVLSAARKSEDNELAKRAVLRLVEVREEAAGVDQKTLEGPSGKSAVPGKEPSR